MNETRQAALPLSGIRVIEMGQNLAGPYAGAILGALGAEVVKVERPEGGDDARAWGPPYLAGSSPTFHAVNSNKSSVTVDLKDAQAVAWLKAAIAKADVLLHNMRPGVMEELGLDAPALLAAHPRLVYCAITAYGSRGPMSGMSGYEQMIQAFSGMWSINGDENGPPTRVGVPILDMGTGVWTALGCIAALHRRHATGRGGLVDTSLLETSLGWMSGHFSAFNATGKQPGRHRSGGPLIFIFEAFETSDGEVMVGAGNDRLYVKLVTELGHAEWATEERFATYKSRLAHKEELLALLRPVFRTASTQAWRERLDAVGVPCAPINEYRQAKDSEQMRALEIFRKVPGLDHEIVGVPVSFDGVRPPIRSAAPTLGEQNGKYGAPQCAERKSAAQGR